MFKNKQTTVIEIRSVVAWGKGGREGVGRGPRGLSVVLEIFSFDWRGGYTKGVCTDETHGTMHLKRVCLLSVSYSSIKGIPGSRKSQNAVGLPCRGAFGMSTVILSMLGVPQSRSGHLPTPRTSPPSPSPVHSTSPKSTSLYPHL